MDAFINLVYCIVPLVLRLVFLMVSSELEAVFRAHDASAQGTIDSRRVPSVSHLP